MAQASVAPAAEYPGIMEFIKIYRSRAAAAGVDPLGVFLPPFAYARMQVLEQAVTGAGTLDARLKDLGANSLDRIEVATCAMEELSIDVPRTRLAGVDSLGSLVDALLGSLPGEKVE